VRPVRLELVGFGAFRDHTEVSFDDVDVVALVGPTGSGKSTIIDAITFALFGSVARYGERDVAPVIHQLATEARVRLTFEVEGVPHDVVRVVRRTRTGASTKEARLQRGEQVLAGNAREVEAEVTRLLGIDAGQFNTTVVLPQGRFADFLQAEPRYRQALLRDLLGLGVYARIGQAARQRAAARAEQARGVDEQVAALGDTSDDAVAALAAQAHRVAAARTEVAALGTELEGVQAERAAASAASEALAGSLRSLAAVVPPPGLSELTERLAAASLAATRAAEALAGARERSRGAARAAEAGPPPGRAERLLAAWADLEQLRAAAEDAAKAESAAAGELQRSSAAADAARRALAAAQDAVAAARSRRTELETQAAGGHSASELSARLADRHDLAAQRRAAEEAGASAAAAEAGLAPLRVALEEATAARERAELLAPAATLAGALVVGEACPVCDHVVTALPAAHRHDRSVVKQAKEAERAAATRLRAADEAHAAVAAEARAARQAAERLEARLAGVPPAAELEAALVVAREREAALDGLRAELEAAERAAAEVERAPATRRALEAERAAERELAVATAARADVAARLASLETSLEGSPSVAVLEAQLADATRLAEARRAALEAEDAAEAVHAAALAELGALQAGEAAARSAFGSARDAVAALGPPAGGGSLAHDWDVLVAWSEVRRAELAAEHRAHEREVARLAAAAESVLARCEVASSGFVAGGWRTVGDLREQLGAAAAAAEAAHEGALASRRRAAELAARRGELQQEAAVAGLLGELLSASAFERWLLDEAMADLVDRATVRLLALTGGQYSLVSEGGGFKVRDHRNADELRDARSLSGGETFLASLALALALGEATTDLASQGSARLESIFLDEGFGTLDPEALDVVASTIEELASSGRMVGLVTHIRELAERMPTRLEVRKTPSTSVVERVDR